MAKPPTKKLQKKGEGLPLGDVKLLDMQEFSDRLSMSREWTKKKIKRGEISVVRIGRSIRIPASELDRVVAEGR